MGVVDAKEDAMCCPSIRWLGIHVGHNVIQYPVQPSLSVKGVGPPACKLIAFRWRGETLAKTWSLGWSTHPSHLFCVAEASLQTWPDHYLNNFAIVSNYKYQTYGNMSSEFPLLSSAADNMREVGCISSRRFWLQCKPIVPSPFFFFFQD